MAVAVVSDNKPSGVQVSLSFRKIGRVKKRLVTLNLFQHFKTQLLREIPG